MPCRKQHQSIAFLTMFSGQALAEMQNGALTAKPFIHAAFAAAATNLPDLIEPATSSHHRQFFHSTIAGGAVLVASNKLYQWQPEGEWEKTLRQLLLVGCGAYLIHLVADAFSPRGLPILGKI